jgi:hypothetical protein
MRRLRDYQAVNLYLLGPSGQRTMRIAATVGVVERGVALLTPDDPGVLDRVRLPTRSTLSFAHGDHAVLLDGLLVRDSVRWLTFLADAHGHVPSRRFAPRLPLELPAQVIGADGGAVATTTVDLSATGALLAARTLGGPGDALQVRLDLPGDHPSVTATAIVVRVTPRGTAVRFAPLDAESTALLRDLVRDVRHAVTQRFAARRLAR